MVVKAGKLAAGCYGLFYGGLNIACFPQGVFKYKQLVKLSDFITCGFEFYC